MSQLDDGVCYSCLNGKGRGRKWAEMSHRVRTDKEFALMCYNAIKSSNKTFKEISRSCALFELFYGLPPGATRPGDRPKLYVMPTEGDEAKVSHDHGDLKAR